MARHIIVMPLSHRPIEEREVELCERKGIGHPDTIADTVCEAASRELLLEAAAGKNPTSHVGKIYNVLAMLMARDIHERLDGADEVSVKLLSAIGERIDRPQVVAIEVGSKHGLTDELRKNATAIADEWLENVHRVTSLILEEKVSLY